MSWRFAFAAAFLLAASQARADATLVMNVAMPRTSSFYLGLYQPWQEAIERESHGRIKIEIPAASLAPLGRQWDMVSSGIADVAMTPDDFIRQRVKLPALAEIPFIAPNSIAATQAIWRTQQKFFAAAQEYKGMKLLGIWLNGGSTVMTMARPVSTIDDFKGLKLWVATPSIKAAVEAFGATPVPSAGASSMFDYVSGGVVDGSVTGKGSLISFQIARYIKYITLFPGQLGYSVFSFFMSEKSYARLAPEDRAVIDRVSYETISRRAAEGFVEQDDHANELVTQYGIAVNTASPAFMQALQARIQFFKTDWLAAAKERGIDGEAAYDYYVKTARDLAAAGK
jgi:TRAP-type C4-dicarboxylate transport system substrate-binding protein